MEWKEVRGRSAAGLVRSTLSANTPLTALAVAIDSCKPGRILVAVTESHVGTVGSASRRGRAGRLHGPLHRTA